MNDPKQPRSVFGGGPSGGQRPAPGDGGTEGPSILSIAWRWKYAITAAFLMFAINAAVILMKITPVYTARGEILLEDDLGPVIDIPNVVREAETTAAYTQSAVIILESGDLLRQVAEDLDLASVPEFNPALRQGEESWLSPGRIRDALRDLLSGGGEDGAGTDSEGEPLGPVVSALRSAIDVRTIGDSLIVEIRATSEDPDLAAEIVNTLAANYIDGQLETKFVAGRRATDWLEGRAESLRQDLIAAEREVEAFRKSRIEAGTATTADLERQTEQIMGEIAQRETELSDIEARRAEVKVLLDRDNFIAATELIRSPVVTDLHRQIAEIDANMFQLESQFGPEYAGLESLRETRTEIENRLRREIGNAVSGLEVSAQILEARIQTLRERLAETRATLTERRVDELQLRELEREAAASQEVYNQFLVRLKEARERSLFQSPDARLLSPAEPPSAPSAPQKTKLTLIAGVFGGGLMLGLGLLISLTRNSVMNERDAWEASGLPVIGNIPLIPRARSYLQAYRWFVERPFSVQAEAVRWLRMGLSAGATEKCEIIMVTSVLAGEGKSTLSLLLSHIFAEAGYRVALIDGDYRRARLSRAIDGPQSDEFALPDNVSFHPVPAEIRPGPTGLGSTVQDSAERVYNILAEQVDTHDRIIIDAPAAMSVSDVAEIGLLAHKSVVVCEWDATPRGALASCVKLLQSSGVRLTGIVLNKVDLRRQARETFPGAERALGRTMSYYSSDLRAPQRREMPEAQRRASS